jgi:hypothetical protein
MPTLCSVPFADYHASARVRRHIDGPLMTWAGQLHWLTWRERLALWLGLTSVDVLAARHWPGYAQRKNA